jgi:hypothetical protein
MHLIPRISIVAAAFLASHLTQVQEYSKIHHCLHTSTVYVNLDNSLQYYDKSLIPVFDLGPRRIW